MKKKIKLVATGVAIWLLILPGGFTAQAWNKGSITFSWIANPPTENVLGYRLYYGFSSRYTSEEMLKLDFAYDYYIDFYEFEQCAVDESGGYSCRELDGTDLRCEDLYSGSPRCTVFNLQPGTTYCFAMTAYNSDAESGYTEELCAVISQKPWNTLQYVSSLLPVMTKTKKR